MSRLRSSPSSQVNEKVDNVVQEYMDVLLADLFPISDTSTQSESNVEDIPEQPEFEQATDSVLKVKEQAEAFLKTVEPLETQELLDTQESLDTEASEVLKSEPVEPSSQTQSVTLNRVESTEIQAIPQEDTSTVAVANEIIEKPLPIADVKDETAVGEMALSHVESEIKVDEPTDTTDSVKVVSNPYEKPAEKLFPNAPDWAQQAFDVLLFDVCGLKLAVPMDTLGKIIKCEKELNALIGRPSWFMGAFVESDENLYVVDTAKYIMPEKGFDLAESGFRYLIQLQRSKWTLACQNVHTTVRLEPDQVKWRSQQGKRKWLAGTVIEHMCALVHVDTLVEILESEAS